MAKKKRRKLTKAQAKEQALRQRQTRRRNWAIAGVVAVVALVLLALYALTGGADINLTEVEPLRADVETGLTEEGYPYRGAADAPVTVVEFSDYQCVYCRDFALETTPIIDDEFIATGQVKYVVQPYARMESSVPIIEAATCARDQGAFWEFHHLAFANQRFFVSRVPIRSVLDELAQAIQLDMDEFDACMDEDRYEEYVLSSTEDGKLEWGVSGTPTFFVNGVLTQLSSEQSYADTMRQAIQAALTTPEEINLTEVEPLRADVETGLTEEGYPYRGAADAPVTLVEFSDYRCGHCRNFALEAAPTIDDELVASGQLKYVVQPYALWEESLPIVEAAACARDQDGFWAFHHLAFANQGLFSSSYPMRTVLPKLAQDIGLDVDEFEACLDEGRHEEEVLASTEDGKLEWKVNSTPTFFVNGVKTQLLTSEPYAETISKAVRAAQGE